MDDLTFSILSLSKDATFSVRFFPMELDAVVAGMEGNKSQGPDGFNFLFYKKFWELIKEEGVYYVRSFFDNQQGGCYLRV